MEVPEKFLPQIPPQDIDVPQVPASPEPTPEVVETPKGVKTPDENLYAALKEERERRKEVELRLKELESVQQTPFVPDEDTWSDEGKNLKKHIDTVGSKMLELSEKLELQDIYTAYPQVRDNASDFNAFRREYPLVSLDKVAKLFLVEKGLIGQQRKGLESSTGGNKAPQPTGMSETDVKRLRETQPRRYAQLLREGKIDPNSIN